MGIFSRETIPSNKCGRQAVCGLLLMKTKIKRGAHVSEPLVRWAMGMKTGSVFV